MEAIGEGHLLRVVCLTRTTRLKAEVVLHPGAKKNYLG